MSSRLRIAILGNSHRAAAKLGRDVIADQHPAVGATFFGATRQVMCELGQEGGALIPCTQRLRECLRTSSNGLDRIVPSDFDRFIRRIRMFVATLHP